MKFKTPDELLQHYAGVRARLYGPRPPAVVTIKPVAPAEPPTAKMAVPSVEEIMRLPAPKILTKTDVPPDQVKIVWDEILALVCHHTGLDHREIFAQRREKWIVHARFLLWALAKKHCHHLSFPQIAKRSGDRDHTTVLHGVRQGVTLPMYAMLDQKLKELYAEKRRLALDAAALKEAEEIAYAGA